MAHLAKLEEAAAEARRKTTQFKPKNGKAHGELPGALTVKGTAIGKAAETVGVSAHTARRLVKAVEAIDTAEQAGDSEQAAEIREVLETQGAKPAAAKVNGKRQKQTPGNDGEITHAIAKVVKLLDERAERKDQKWLDAYKICVERCHKLHEAWATWRGSK